MNTLTRSAHERSSKHLKLFDIDDIFKSQRGLSTMSKALTRLLTALIVALSINTVFAAKVGDAVPSFEASTLDGTGIVNSADLAGKVVFVDFWASWCTPCLKSLPEFEKLQTSFSGRDDVVVLAINLDENPKDANKFLNKINVSYQILADHKGKIPESFGVNTMPSSYIIDKEGVIRYVHRGYKTGDVDKIKSEIEQLL